MVPAAGSRRMPERSGRSAPRCARRLRVCAAPAPARARARRRADLVARGRGAARRALSGLPVLKALPRRWPPSPRLCAAPPAPAALRRCPCCRRRELASGSGLPDRTTDRQTDRATERPRRASPRPAGRAASPRRPRPLSLLFPFSSAAAEPHARLAHVHRHAGGELLRGSARFNLVHSERSDTLC